MITYNTCIPPILGDFLCLQAYNLLTCDQPDPKDNFLPKTKYDILTHFDATASLNSGSTQRIKDRDPKISCSSRSNSPIVPYKKHVRSSLIHSHHLPYHLSIISTPPYPGTSPSHISALLTSHSSYF